MRISCALLLSLLLACEALPATNELSAFKIVSVSNSAPGVVVFFTTSSNWVYALHYATNLVAGPWTEVPGQTNLSGSGATMALADTHATETRFYRVQAQPATNQVVATDTVVKFQRTTYTDSFPLSLATDVAHGISLYTLQANFAGRPASIKAAAAAAGASMKVLAYMNLLFTANTPGADYTRALPYSIAWANGYLATNAAGHTIYNNSYPTFLVVNITNAGAQAAIVTHVEAILSSGGFDGVFLDDCDSYLPFMNLRDSVTSQPTTPAFAGDNATLENAVAGALAVIVPQLQAAGYYVLGNTGNLGINPPNTMTPTKHLGPILAGSPPNGGVYLESWADGGAGLAQQMTTMTDGMPADMHAMAAAIYLDSRGIDVVCHNQNTTAAGQIFGLAMMMLCTTGHCYYTTDNNLSNTDNWFLPAFATALASGAPTSPVVTPNTPNGTGADAGLYVRTFENCTVKVNFSATATVNGLPPLTATIN